MSNRERQTYIYTPQYQQDLVQDRIDRLMKKHFSCQEVLRELQVDQRLVGNSALVEMYAKEKWRFLGNREELVKLVGISLAPEKQGCRDAGWSFIATEMLKTEPPELLIRLIEPPSRDAHVLFDFLEKGPNSTQLGYFGELMACVGNDFQDKVPLRPIQLLMLLMNNRPLLKRCQQSSYYQSVFMSMFNAVIFSSENYREFQQELLGMLFGKLMSSEHRLEYSSNVLEMLRSCNEDLKKYTVWVCTVVIGLLDDSYVSHVVSVLEEQRGSSNSELTENLLDILCGVIELYLKITTINQNPGQTTTIPTTAIEGGVIRIIKSTGVLIDILRVKSSAEIPFSNGQIINPVGLVKYNALLVISKVMALPEELIKAHFDFSKEGILVDMQQFITRNPWNNMAQGLVQQIVISVVDKLEVCKELEESLVGQNGFLAFLIETFKNKKYMFLNSCELSTYGYLHYLYNMAAAVCSKLQKSENLKSVMKKFKPWEQFVMNDLRKYEQTLDQVLGEPMSSAARHSKQQIIRRIIIDLNQKNIDTSVLNEEKPEEGLLDRFYEVIHSQKGFKKGRITVLRKNSVDEQKDTPVKLSPKSKSMTMFVVSSENEDQIDQPSSNDTWSGQQTVESPLANQHISARGTTSEFKQPAQVSPRSRCLSDGKLHTCSEHPNREPKVVRQLQLEQTS